MLLSSGWQGSESTGGVTKGPPAVRWSMAECMTVSHRSSMFGITKIFYEGEDGETVITTFDTCNGLHKL